MSLSISLYCYLYYLSVYLTISLYWPPKSHMEQATTTTNHHETQVLLMCAEFKVHDQNVTKRGGLGTFAHPQSAAAVVVVLTDVK